MKTSAKKRQNPRISEHLPCVRVIYWELGVENWTRTGSILIIYKMKILILKIYFFDDFFVKTKNIIFEKSQNSENQKMLILNENSK